jgi:hypothetical protein
MILLLFLLCCSVSFPICYITKIPFLTSQKWYLTSDKPISPYRSIGNQEEYIDSYDVVLPLQHGGYELWLQTHALPYVEDYYIIFKDYKKDDGGYSLLADKDIMMNFGDVLLAVDGLDIEGKKLGDIMNMLQGKSSNRVVKLTFLIKEWFNWFDRVSVKTASAIQKRR